MRLFYSLTKLATPIFGLAWFLFGALPVLAVDYHITGDVIWSGEGAPIVYGDNNDGIDNVVVDENSSLTILPGTVVKMGWWGKIKVLGKLNIAGTAERPVVLTRLSDTENGAEYVPQAILDDYKQPGNWAGILVDRRGTVKGELNMKYAKILYSDGPLSSYGTTTIESSLFSHNTSWIRSIDSSFIMHNSAILDETGNSGLYLKKAASPSGGGIFACSFDSENVLVPMYDVSKNYWGADGGPCLVVNEDGSTDEERYGDCAGRTKLDFYPAGFKSEVSYQPFLASMPEWLSGVENKEPVILIPGILGSWGSDEEWILDPVLNTYTNLYEALKLAGYEEGKTLFAMPYNWRESNVDTAYLLKDKVEAVKRIAGTGRVNLIAHSMGGLVARYYAQELDGAKNIDKLIFLATPQRGSPKSYLAVEGGDVGIELSDFFVEMALKNEAEERGYSSLGDYIRNKPLESVKQLLPVYDYLSYGGQELNYPNNYPRNTFLEQLNSTASLQKLKDYVGVYNFVGLVKGDDGLFDASSTYAGFKLQAYASSSANGNWADGMPVNYLTSKTDGVVYNYGDGTVPSESNRQFLGLEAIPVYADHTSMVSGSQNRVIKILTGVEPVEEVNRTKAHNFLFFTIFSPADFMITAPDGKRIGRNIDGAGKIEEISGAYYSGFNTDREVVIIPNPLAGEYKVSLLGTDNGGSYRMRSEYIADGVKQSSEMTSNIKAGEKQELLMNYKEASFTASSTAELQFELTLDETASVVMATTTNLATSVVSGQAMLVNTLALPQVLSTSSDGALINSVIELESSGDNNEKLAWLMSSIDHWREGQNLTTYYVNKFLLVARSLQKQEELINGKITALKETMETIKKNQYLSNIEKQQLIAQAQDLINYNLVLLKYYARLNLNQLQEYLNTAVNRRKINTADYVIIRASLDQIRLFYEKRA